MENECNMDVDVVDSGVNVGKPDNRAAVPGDAHRTACMRSGAATIGVGKRSNSKFREHCESYGPAGTTVPGFIGLRSC